MSKALTGKLRLDSRPVSLAEASRQAVAAATPAAQAKGVAHHVRDSRDVGAVVLGDPTRLRQIAWHLLANAIKFTPRGGDVELDGRCRDGDARADRVATAARASTPSSCRGSSTGSPRRIRRRRGRRADSASGCRSSASSSSCTAARFAARNSDGGRGAMFTARFPLQPVEGESRRRRCSAGGRLASSPPLDGLRVLVLDQDADGRELLRTVLQQRGAPVRTADSVADALEVLEAWRPDVLVSDSVSPEHDSYALVGKVQSLEADRGGRIPAVALTTFGRDRRARAPDAGRRRSCDLPKPVEPAILTAEIARLTGRERRAATPQRCGA